MHSRGFVVFFPHKNAGLPNVCCMFSLCSSQGITPFFSSTNTSFSLSKTIHGLTFSNHLILVCKMSVCIFFFPKCTVPQSNSRNLYSLHSWVRSEIFQVSRKKKYRAYLHQRGYQSTSPHTDSQVQLSHCYSGQVSLKDFLENIVGS